MSISTNQFKNGTHIEVDGQIFRILEFQHVKPGKGGAFVRTKLRNVGSGGVLDKTFRAGEKVRPVRTETRKMQYLYQSGDEAVLMDLGDYEQLVAAEDRRRRRRSTGSFRTTRSRCCSWTSGPRASSCRAPSRWPSPRPIPGVRGDTASGGGTKPATLESGVIVQVPLFVNEGDRVRVDTRTREYVARA